MKVGLVGFPGSGKTTVFNALTGLSAETGFASRGKSQQNLGVVKVPDARVDGLAALYAPKKTTYAEVAFVDLAQPPGEGGKGLTGETIQTMREYDALCQVVRAFTDPMRDDAEPHAAREVEDFALEMVLADLTLVEKRLERCKKERGKPAEIAALEKMKPHLEANRPLRELALAENEWSFFSGFRFLTQKPLLLLLNVEEADAARPAPDALASYAREHGLGLMTLSGKVEMEIAQLPPGEQKDFVQSLGLAEPARLRFIAAAYALLDLISFLTAGPDECRAWPIRRGTTAQRAAGKIHSDIERGFIRAEVVPYTDLVELRSEARCREAGKLRLEGKEYVVQDGDVAHFRFNV